MIRATGLVGVLSGLIGLIVGVPHAFAHGDMAPQAVETKDLPKLGKDWKRSNPYRNAKAPVFRRAVEVGSQGYNSNCAACHGLEGISGGLTPDLRKLEVSAYGDAWFIDRVANGYSQNGVFKMPPFKSILSQEAAWAIRTYVESRPNIEELSRVRAAGLALRAKIGKAKNPRELKVVVNALHALAKQVTTVSGGPRADTPMSRAAALLKVTPPNPRKAVRVLTEGLAR